VKGSSGALHCCLTLALLEDAELVPTKTLAATFDLPPAYLNKCLQALVRAEILSSSPGVKGGFRLACSPEKISLLDVVTAIEGSEESFRCAEIRRCGAAPPPMRASCQTMRDRGDDAQSRGRLASRTRRSDYR